MAVVNGVTATESFLVMKNLKKWLLLTLFSLIIFSINIWTDGIYSAQEGRAAIVANNMIESGNWLHISVKGAVETEKPVMCYWFYALSGSLFGINEFSVRLPSIIASVTTVLLACWLGIRIYGKSIGFMAGYVLSTMIGFVNLGRLARIDIVLCAFYSAAMVFLYIGYFEKRRPNRFLYLFYLVLALSVMIKGPVSVVLAGLTVVALVVKERDPRIIWHLKPLSGLLIGLAINAPWYIYETLRTQGAFAEDFFLYQNLSRFTGINMSYCGGKRQTILYYIPKLFGMTLPWSLFIPVALYNFRHKWRNFKPNTWFLLIWGIVVFVFFSLAAIKRGDYLLPMFLPMAILLGRYLVWVSELQPKLSRKWLPFWYGIIVLGVLAAIGIRVGLLGYVGKLAAADKLPHISQRDGMGMVQVSDFINANFMLCAFGLILVLAALFQLGKLLERGRIKTAIKGFIVGLFVFFCIFYIWLDPAQNKFKTVKYFCVRAKQHIAPNQQVCYYREWVTEVVFFMERDYERTSQLKDIYDETTGKFNYRFIITDPRGYRDFPEEVKEQLLVLETTIPDHHYPLMLLESTSAK